MRCLLIAALIALALPAAAQDAAGLLSVMGEDALPPGYDYLVAVDGSSNSRDGSCSTTNILTDSGGWFADLDGTAEYIRVPTLTNYYSPTFTMMAWVYRVADAGGNEQIISLTGPVGGDADDYDTVFQIIADDTFNAGFVDTGNAVRTINSAATIPMNTWTLCGVSWDGTHVKAWVNGVVSGTSADFSSSTRRNNALDLQMGRLLFSGNYSYGFEGRLADVRYYSGTSATNEFANLYAAGVHAPIDEVSTNTLQGFWSMIPEEQ